MGTGVVGFNIRPKKALMCDSNPHLINFYNALKSKEITSAIVHQYLTQEGAKLLSSDGAYYYELRSRFNETGNPLDFLFLSRTCFNGLMRFNKKGGFNVPFCNKPSRFAQALVTKITNQVEAISQIIDNGDYTFENKDFKDVLNQIDFNDFVYADSPYIGRHVDYFDSWSVDDELLLNDGLVKSQVKFILSTWLSNRYRVNNAIFEIWKDTFITTKEHFYHVGGKEINRNAVYEALLSNMPLNDGIPNAEMQNRVHAGKPLLTSKPKPKTVVPTLFDGASMTT